MSTRTSNSRNFSLFIPDDLKEELRVLAGESGMNLTQYIESLLISAKFEKTVFERMVRPVKRESAALDPASKP